VVSHPLTPDRTSPITNRAMNSETNDREFDIITFGDMCVDLVVSGGDIVPRFGQVEQLVGDYAVEMGGSCCIFACQAARLGMRVGILGRVGDDSFGRLIVRKLEACGVDTRHVIVDPQLKTGLSIALTRDGDRAILTYLGSIRAIEPGDVGDAFLGSARHLHHGSFFLHTGLRPVLPAIFARAHALGLTTSLDTGWDPDEHWNGNLQQVLAHTDVCLPNEQEAQRIGGGASLAEAIERLRARVPMLALKRGAEGATLYANGQSLDSHPLPAATGGDSIGAGDSFDAGFLAGWLRGMPLETCLKIASYCGRAVASAVGGLAGQPTWEELQRYFEGNRNS
jgi:ribokinase